LYHAYYNFCLPHASIRLPLLQPLPTNGSGSAKTWRPCTPAIAVLRKNSIPMALDMTSPNRNNREERPTYLRGKSWQ
jgi:hypothetical protein